MNNEMNHIESPEIQRQNLFKVLRTRWRASLLLSIGVLVFGMGAIQLVPVDRTNPPVTCEIQWESVETRAIAVAACYDCHSNETVWPWYSKIAPVSWRVVEHVDEGREYINFSEWDLQGNPEKLIEEFEEVILDDSMPTWDYRLIHSEAKLSDNEKQQVIDGFALSVRQYGNSCAE